MNQPNTELQREFEDLCDSLKKANLTRQFRERIKGLNIAITKTPAETENPEKTEEIKGMLEDFKKQIEMALDPKIELSEDEKYVYKNFSAPDEREFMLYLIKNIGIEISLQKASEDTGFSIKQLYDLKKRLKKKLAGNDNYKFIMATASLKHGILKLIRRCEENEEIQYTDEDITQAQEWVRVKFQGKMISRLTMILTENLGKFVSMEQISKEFPNARRNFLSTYISRLRRKLIREKSLYVIEKERGRYKLVIKNRLLRWTIKTSQNEPVCKKALEHLIMAPLGTQIKIVDWQNTITKQFPQTKPEEITEKINRLIIEICTKTQENEFKAVAKKGMIALYESNKIPPEESITENVGKFDEQKMHVRFRARALTDY